MGVEAGLFYPDGSFLSRTQINHKLILQDLGKSASARMDNLHATPRTFDEWTSIMTRRQDEREEVCKMPESAIVEIATDRPILLALMADDHIGGEGTDHKRLASDVKLIKSVGGYTVTVGDLTNSAFFMPDADSQVATNDEQVLYAQVVLEELAYDGHLLAGWGGDHDLWAKDKMGSHTLYHDFRQRYNAHYFEGISYLTVNLRTKDKLVPFYMVGSHRHKGFSVYNDAHASWRQQLDESNGVDDIISFTAHNHIKAYLRQVRKMFNGDEKTIHAIALGAYKKTDRYSRKMGWPRQADKGIGAFGLVLDPDEGVKVFWSIEEAIKELQQSS